MLGVAAIVAAAGLIGVHNLHRDNSPNQILNVSNDPTRELYLALDKSFVDQFRRQTGVTVEVKQSHGSSGRQAAEVTKGHEKPDVVSLAKTNSGSSTHPSASSPSPQSPGSTRTSRTKSSRLAPGLTWITSTPTRRKRPSPGTATAR